MPCLKRLNVKLFGYSGTRYSVSERPHVYRENPPYGYHGGLFLISRQQNNNNRIEQTKTTQDLCFGGESHLKFEVFFLKFLIFLDQLARRSRSLSMRSFKVTFFRIMTISLARGKNSFLFCCFHVSLRLYPKFNTSIGTLCNVYSLPPNFQSIILRYLLHGLPM